MFDKIPQNPGGPQYRHGGAIPGGHLEWFRAKTGNGRFRLFYRYDSTSRIVIYAWVNNTDTLRTYGATTDAYAVFGKMLTRGNPPTDWETLLEQARREAKTAAHVFRKPAPRRP